MPTGKKKTKNYETADVCCCCFPLLPGKPGSIGMLTVHLPCTYSDVAIENETVRQFLSSPCATTPKSVLGFGGIGKDFLPFHKCYIVQAEGG